jgi:drug/metabolite transporter (DMT)-like permease
MDLISTVLSCIGLNMVASSEWQISRGGSIIVIAIFLAFFLKQVFERKAIIGCFLSFIGITIVQIITVVCEKYYNS